MNSTLDEAIYEAERFLAKASEFQEKCNTEYTFMGDKYSASLRRSSMDLTRSLAEMRKASTNDWKEGLK